MRSLIAGAVVTLSALTACASTQSVPGGVAGGEVALVQPGELALQDGMRRMWADHVIWTRQYIVAAVSDDPSASAAATRLMKNQEDIGNAIIPFYGSAAGTKLTGLLKEHITIAVDLVKAAKAGDNAKVSDADRRWHENAVAIATFLSGANPNWSRDEWTAMLNDHLSLTTQEATARIQHRWTDDTALFDRIFTQAMHMADELTDGIAKQFPTKV